MIMETGAGPLNNPGGLAVFDSEVDFQVGDYLIFTTTGRVIF